MRPAAEREPAPSFWDPGLHLERPDLSGLRAIRFLTDDDYPPLDFALADGSLSGFNVDIARAICEELHIGCTIQARRWDTLIDSLETGKGDAVIASISANAAARARIDFTQPYYQTPARFATRKDSPLTDATPDALAGKAIGVVAGSAHQSYLATFFPRAVAKTYPSFAALHDALKGGRDRRRLRRRIEPGGLARRRRFRATAASSRADPTPRAAFSAKASASPCARRTPIYAAPWTGRWRALRRAASTPRSISSIFRWGSTERAEPPMRRTAEEPTGVATGLVPAIPRRGDCGAIVRTRRLRAIPRLSKLFQGNSKPFPSFSSFSKEIPNFFFGRLVGFQWLVAGNKEMRPSPQFSAAGRFSSTRGDAAAIDRGKG